MAKREISTREKVEFLVESSMFSSRWLMAPIYIILCLSLAVITLKVLQHFVITVPHMARYEVERGFVICITNC